MGDKKVALVLSGGGAKGAFQFMAEKYARVEMGYQWDIIAGVSVGALNAAMLAMKKYERLEEVWWNITNDQVYTGKLNFWSILKIAFGAQSIYSNDPLWKMLQAEYDHELVDVDLRIGVVSLRTGEYVRFVPSEPGFVKAILASTAIPIVWKPVQVSPAYPDMVDGGVRNCSPLGDVLDSDPDEIVIINCNPQHLPGPNEPLRNALDIGKHTLEVAMNEIFVTDIREFLRINEMVKEAADQGVTLHKKDGSPYKYYKCTLIEPDEPLGNTIDFSKEINQIRLQAGWDKAKEVFEGSL